MYIHASTRALRCRFINLVNGQWLFDKSLALSKCLYILWVHKSPANRLLSSLFLQFVPGGCITTQMRIHVIQMGWHRVGRMTGEIGRETGKIWQGRALSSSYLLFSPSFYVWLFRFLFLVSWKKIKMIHTCGVAATTHTQHGDYIAWACVTMTVCRFGRWVCARARGGSMKWCFKSCFIMKASRRAKIAYRMRVSFIYLSGHCHSHG